MFWPLENMENLKANNFIVGSGEIDVRNFTNNGAFRDSQINDAFDNVVAYVWGDNSTISDKDNNVMNCFVAIGEVVNGQVYMRPAIDITSLGEPNITSLFDHAITINRSDKNNIVVSYRISDIRNVSKRLDKFCRAVSFDNGLTWPIKGDIGVTGIANDCPGVRSDKFGNIWYLISGLNNDKTKRVNFFVSSDKGVTFTEYYRGPPVKHSNYQLYDFPQFCFGNYFSNEKSQYGLYFVTDYVIDKKMLYKYPLIGFIEINGLNNFGSVINTTLPKFSNMSMFSDIAASNDGKVWLHGIPNFYNWLGPKQSSILFKEPGPISQGWSSFKLYGLIANYDQGPSNEISYPQFGYMVGTTRTIIYDNRRKVLYLVAKSRYPRLSQDSTISLFISKNDGKSWSESIPVNDSSFGNRGYQTMALDEITGNLLFGFYDGRNDATFKTVQYFGAIIPSAKLDELVNRI